MEKQVGIPKLRQRRSDIPEGWGWNFFGNALANCWGRSTWSRMCFSRYSCGILLDAWISSHWEMEPSGFGSAKENWEFGCIIKKNIQWAWDRREPEAGMGMRTLDKHGNAQG